MAVPSQECSKSLRTFSKKKLYDSWRLLMWKRSDGFAFVTVSAVMLVLRLKLWRWQELAGVGRGDWDVLCLWFSKSSIISPVAFLRQHFWHAFVYTSDTRPCGKIGRIRAPTLQLRWIAWYRAWGPLTNAAFFLNGILINCRMYRQYSSIDAHTHTFIWFYMYIYIYLYTNSKANT